MNEFQVNEWAQQERLVRDRAERRLLEAGLAVLDAMPDDLSLFTPEQQRALAELERATATIWRINAIVPERIVRKEGGSR